MIGHRYDVENAKTKIKSFFAEEKTEYSSDDCAVTHLLFLRLFHLLDYDYFLDLFNLKPLEEYPLEVHLKELEDSHGIKVTQFTYANEDEDFLGFYLTPEELKGYITAIPILYYGEPGKSGHWISLVIDYRGDTPICYHQNSLGGEVKEGFKKLLIETNFPNTVWVDLKCKQQDDEYNCGPYAIENCALIAAALTTIDANEQLDSREEIKKKTSDKITKIKTAKELRELHKKYYFYDHNIESENINYFSLSEIIPEENIKAEVKSLDESGNLYTVHNKAKNILKTANSATLNTFIRDAENGAINTAHLTFILLLIKMKESDFKAYITRLKINDENGILQEKLKAFLRDYFTSLNPANKAITSSDEAAVEQTMEANADQLKTLILASAANFDKISWNVNSDNPEEQKASKRFQKRKTNFKENIKSIVDQEATKVKNTKDFSKLLDILFVSEVTQAYLLNPQHKFIKNHFDVMSSQLTQMKGEKNMQRLGIAMSSLSSSMILGAGVVAALMMIGVVGSGGIALGVLLPVAIFATIAMGSMGLFAGKTMYTEAKAEASEKKSLPSLAGKLSEKKITKSSPNLTFNPTTSASKQV